MLDLEQTPFLKKTKANHLDESSIYQSSLVLLHFDHVYLLGLAEYADIVA